MQLNSNTKYHICNTYVFFSKEFVVGNIAVFYSQVAQREVLYLQDYVKTNNRVFDLNITASAVDALNGL